MSTNVIWIYQIVITLIIAIIGYLIQDMMKSNKEKHAENRELIQDVKGSLEKTELSLKQELEKIKDEHNQFKQDMPLVYVLRDDFLRAMATVEKKLDKIYDLVSSNSNKRKEE